MNSNMKIAGDLTIEDWYKTKEKLKPLYNDNWKEAYDFFEKRITFRYLKPIEAILALRDKKGEGFAVINLQCSLIETIESFINGWVYNTEKDEEGRKISNKWYHNNKLVKNKEDKDLKNLNIFESFFENREPFKKMFEENNLEGNDFYWNVRCGLLHETQTKNGWRIKVSNKDNTKSITNDKIIYRENFHRDINNVIENYKSTIVEGKPFDDKIGFEELRQNFIIKINHICKQS